MFKKLSLLLFLNSLLFAEISSELRSGLRFGIEDQDGSSVALGGYLHSDLTIYDGVVLGVSLHSTNPLFGSNDSRGIGFFDANNKAYSILDEAYLKLNVRNSTITLGRQELDTPFVNSDDIGMIANRYEAYTMISEDLIDTTLMASYITRMSGVDSDNPSHFSRVNGDKNALALGASYGGFDGVGLNLWYYDFRDEVSIVYGDLNYELDQNNLHYSLVLQVADEDFKDSEDAFIYGAAFGVRYSDVTLSIAYNKSKDGTASNGFGGGPFLTSMEHLTLAESGDDGEVLSYGVELDLDEFVPNSSLYISRSDLSSKSEDANELDLVLGYEISDDFGLDLIYSDVDDDINGDDFTNVRFFINYNFKG